MSEIAVDEKADTFMRIPSRLIRDLGAMRAYPKEPLWKVVDRIRIFFTESEKGE